MSKKKKEPRELGGFKFPNSPIRWVLEPTINEAITMAQLLDRFYEWFIDYQDEEIIMPKAMLRDPEKEGKRIYSELSTMLVIIYYQNFHCLIEKQFGEIFGPHCCKLLWNNNGELAWVATLQISEMFYSDEKILQALTRAIREKEFFQSETTKEEIIVIS